ncbi:GTPase [Phytopseudomonas dryadis]|uniref:GTPase n=1 Tax=Phytopseudomonas dryadis TaxID=2487520 RepID=A0A4Q9QXW9_9GAMM|nr:GTPase [Pseudomonas dryadis]TBU88448.1 GTPase [Pseudomonas dryadis]
MDHQSIRNQMPILVSGHLPSNARTFQFEIFDGEPKLSSNWGHHIDPKPFEGRVIARTDDVIIVKTGRTRFAVVDRTLATEDPEEGAKVLVEPYARHRFDGLRADTPEESVEYTSDGQPVTFLTYVLGSAPAKLPIAQPRCPELRDLIQQLEDRRAPDGYRHITHMLVDAQACDFSVVDPKPADIVRTPPTISFNVTTGKFQGRVSLLYQRAGDLYAIELHQGDQRVERREYVDYSSLGKVLAELIDDGSWRRIRVSTVQKPARRKPQAATA